MWGGLARAAGVVGVGAGGGVGRAGLGEGVGVYGEVRRGGGAGGGGPALGARGWERVVAVGVSGGEDLGEVGGLREGQVMGPARVHEARNLGRTTGARRSIYSCAPADEMRAD